MSNLFQPTPKKYFLLFVFKFYWPMGFLFNNLPLKFVCNPPSVETVVLQFCYEIRKAYILCPRISFFASEQETVFIWSSKLVVALNFSKNLICKILTVFCVVSLTSPSPPPPRLQTTPMAVYFCIHRGKDLNGRWLFRTWKPIMGNSSSGSSTITQTQPSKSFN